MLSLRSDWCLNYQVTQHNLRCSLAIFFGNNSHLRRIDKVRLLNIRLGLSQRRVARQGDVVLLAEGCQSLLVERRRALHLVSDGFDLAVGQNSCQLLAVEVGYSDAAHQAQFYQLFHGFVRIQIVHIAQLEHIVLILWQQGVVIYIFVAHWHMHQIQIDVVQAKIAQLLAANTLNALRIVKNVPKLLKNIILLIDLEHIIMALTLVTRNISSRLTTPSAILSRIALPTSASFW